MKNSLFIILAGFFWGLIPLFVTSLKNLGFDSLQIVAVRVSFTAILFIFICLLKNPSTLKIKFRHIPYFLGTGVLSIACFNFCYFQSIKMIGGASVPALLLYTSPIFVMILSLIFFKEKLSIQKIIALCLTFAGLAFVTGVFSELHGNSHKIPLPAIFIGLGSGFCYALYSIFGKLIGNRYSTLTITTFTFVTAAVFTVPVSGVFDKITLLFSFKSILMTIVLAFFCTVLPFLLYTSGLKEIDAGKAAVLATVEPIVAAGAGFIFLDEEMNIFKIIGILLILSSIVVLNLNSKESLKNNRVEK